MDPAVAVTILLVVVVVAALAIFLIGTILELRKITQGLDVVIQGVGEIVTKTAPVNGVLGAINGTLITGRNVLEGLFLKKAGDDAAGLVESCFPGEGAKFLQRVGRSGTVKPIGEEYPPGAATLGALVAATRGEAPPAPAPPPEPHPAATPSGRIVLRSSGSGSGAGLAPPAPRLTPTPAPPPPASAGGGAEAAPAEAAPAEGTPGVLNVRGARPWEQGGTAPSPPPPPPPPPPPADDAGAEGPPGVLNVRGTRPWER